MSVTCCTGVAAQWCPIHGECTCEENAAGERIMGGDEAKDCPLHGPSSTHAEPAADEFEEGEGI